MKIDLSKYQAVIFDMDGTMIDNSKYHNLAWEEFHKRHNISFNEAEFFKKTSGNRNDAILKIIFEREIKGKELEELGEEKEFIYRELFRPNFKAVNGIESFINKLISRGLKIGVATTSYYKNRVFILETLKLQDAFDIIVGEEHVSHGKPHPEIYLLAAKKLNVDPKECLAFEDSPAGVKSAKAAGMEVSGVLTAHNKEELSEADYFIKDFTEIEI